MQKVEVWVGIYGDYCGFDEMSIRIEFDVTNNIAFNSKDLDYYENFNDEDSYYDYALFDAILSDGKYYIQIT